jgi:2-polyprenyl-3-methyl-5-hydroxy-6-metoxy-1,4-benzoquinol methylase
LPLNRQSIADLPFLTRGNWWAIFTRVRYWARRAAFAVPFVRGKLERKQLDRGAAAAHWDNLMSRTNAATYLGGTINVDSCNAMTAMMIKHRAPSKPSVLDIGCAGGTLLSALTSYQEYLGIDVSAFAVELAARDFARHVATGCVSFTASDLRDYQPQRAWDVIIFNEVLYYLSVADAVAEFGRYAEFLTPDGIACVSMKDDAKSRAIMSFLARRYRWRDGMLWQVKPAAPSYSVGINRETPAVLLAVFARA